MFLFGKRDKKPPRFKDTPFENRKAESKKIALHYPQHIPVIIEPHHSRDVLYHSGTQLPARARYIVPSSHTFGALMASFKNKVDAEDCTVHFLSHGKEIPTSEERLEDHMNFLEDDGFYYLYYAKQ